MPAATTLVMDASGSKVSVESLAANFQVLEQLGSKFNF